jgi:lipopolysaccharide transport system ATP-binding protein
MRKAEMDRKFDAIVAFAQVSKFLDTPVKRYSSGMKVRLAFAVAAHLEPEILLVDEVLAVGDVAFQQKCLGKMSDVTKEGRTVLFVSHNMGAVNDLCERCLMLDGGHLREDGPTGSVIPLYLGQGTSGTPVLTLEPIKSEAYFNTLGLYNSEHEPSTRFDVRNPITILFGFTLAHRIQGLQVSLSLFNAQGGRIFYTSNTKGDSSAPIEEAGTHCVAAQIPGRFLPPGRYFINAALHRPNIQLYDHRKQVLSFEVEETGSGLHELRSGLGYVLMDLKWEKRAST